MEAAVPPSGGRHRSPTVDKGYEACLRKIEELERSSSRPNRRFAEQIAHLQDELRLSRRRFADDYGKIVAERDSLAQQCKMLDSKCKILAGRLVAVIRQKQLDESSEVAFIVRKSEGMQDAAAHLVETLREVFPSPHSSPPKPAAMSWTANNTTQGPVMTDVELVSSCHTIAAAARSAAAESHTRYAEAQNQLLTLMGKVGEANERVRTAAILLHREKSAFHEIFSPAHAVETELEREASVVPMIDDRAHQSSETPQQPQQVNDSGSQHTPFYDHGQQVSVDPINNGDAQLRSVLGVVNEVFQILCEALYIMKNITTAPPAGKDDFGATLATLRTELEGLRAAHHHSVSLLTQRYETEALEHRNSVASLRSRLEAADAEYTRLLLSPNCTLEPSAIEILQASYLESTSGRMRPTAEERLQRKPLVLSPIE